MKAVKVTLRKRLLPSGRITLYLDFYPPLRDPVTMQNVRHEYLGIYLVNKPRFAIEKEANKEKIRQAEALRSERELQIIREQFNFMDEHKAQLDFLAYFRKKLDIKDQKWIRVYDHFNNYCHGRCHILDSVLLLVEVRRPAESEFHVSVPLVVRLVESVQSHPEMVDVIAGPAHYFDNQFRQMA